MRYATNEVWHAVWRVLYSRRPAPNNEQYFSCTSTPRHYARAVPTLVSRPTSDARKTEITRHASRIERAGPVQGMKVESIFSHTFDSHGNATLHNNGNCAFQSTKWSVRRDRTRRRRATQLQRFHVSAVIRGRTMCTYRPRHRSAARIRHCNSQPL